jgi:gamma-glutamylcyclotransferase (GGCT)/AIG2-like uncharacterized protein YtfP
MTNEVKDKMPDMRPYQNNQIQYLFVYGTLKRTFPRVGMLKYCSYVMDDSIKGYLLHHGPHPGAVLEQNAPKIHGEVWRLPTTKDNFNALFEDLDQAEGWPSYYWKLPILTFKNNIAWVYFLSRDYIDTKSTLVIPDGTWRGKDLSEQVKFAKFVNDHPQYSYPSKPKMKYQHTSRCLVVEQHSSDYLSTYCEHDPKWGGTLRPGAQNYPFPSEKVPPVGKDSPPLFELMFLDPKGSKPEKCPEERIDAI